MAGLPPPPFLRALKGNAGEDRSRDVHNDLNRSRESKSLRCGQAYGGVVGAAGDGGDDSVCVSGGNRRVVIGISTCRNRGEGLAELVKTDYNRSCGLTCGGESDRTGSRHGSSFREKLNGVEVRRCIFCCNDSQQLHNMAVLKDLRVALLNEVTEQHDLLLE